MTTKNEYDSTPKTNRFANVHQVLKNIRALRDMKGYSQEFMATQLKLTPSSYSRFENGPKKIDFQVVEQIAQLFQISVAQLVELHLDTRYFPEQKNTLAPTSSVPSPTLDVNLLTEKNRHLEDVVSFLSNQLKDKEQIIDLLKGR